MFLSFVPKFGVIYLPWCTILPCYQKDIFSFFVKPLRTIGNIFVVNLALADFSLTSFVDPFSIVGK